MTMKIGLLARHGVVLVLIILAWWFSRHVNPALVTLIGILLIGGSTIWFVVSLAKTPNDIEASAKSWWRLMWDGFWGL